MSARFVNGRILIEEEDEEEDDDVDRQMATTITRNKFQQLSQQYQEDEHTRRWGEYKPRKSMALTQMMQEGVDSESEYEPEENVTSLSVGMIPEFIFNIMIFLKICVGFYLFGTGLTSMRWNVSIQSFVNPHDDSDFDLGTAIKRPVEELDFSENGIDGLELIWLGVGIMAVSIFDVMFCLILWHAVFNYMKQKIIIFCLLLVFIELFFIFVAWYIHARASCDTKNIVKFLETYLNSFGFDKLSTRKVNEVQFNLGCCGLKGWKDYIDLKEASKLPNVTNFYPQEAQALVPFSCCRFPWSAHLYCGFEAEKWATDLTLYKKAIERRFYTTGCKDRIKILCNRIVAMLSIHMEIAYTTYVILNIFISLMVYFIIQKINLMRLEAESLYDFNKLEIIDNAFESDDSAEFDKFSDEEAGGGDTKAADVPTLKEIYQQMNVIESRGAGIDTKAQLRDMVEAYHKSMKQKEQRVGSDPQEPRHSLPSPPPEADLHQGDTVNESPETHPLQDPTKLPPNKTMVSKSPSINSTLKRAAQKDLNPKPIQTQTRTPYNDQLAKLAKKPPPIAKKQPMESSARKIGK
ncbi:unnamed protein product [Allacma fusca]|uniref:Tetraspanin n=1 Tax=Allacma fusca TaxID=39272 RepID=A0A8J2NY56_9HEXA|nr:unnamed protein product [Allacma fusca]